MGISNKKSLQDEWVAISQHLTDEDIGYLLKNARPLAKKNIFLKKIRESESKPELYINSPRSISLIDFIKTEWVEKGWNPPDIERKLLQEYDPKLLKAITDYENKNCRTLPEELRFKKVRNRLSLAERVGRVPETA